MSKKFLFGLVLGLSLVFYVIFAVFKYQTFRTWQLSDEVCDKSLPDGYYVAYNSDTKVYAIRHTYQYLHYIKRFGWSSTVYSSFSDSCIAKAFYFAYIEDVEAELKRNNFK